MAKETRKDPRAKILSMTVRYKSATVDEFIEHYSYDISRGGIFIKTPSPFAQGTLLKFEIKISDDRQVLQGVGRVVWKRDGEQGTPERPAGMGVKFIKISDASKEVIERLAASKPLGAQSSFESELPGREPVAGASLSVQPVAPRTGVPMRKGTMIGLGSQIARSASAESVGDSSPPSFFPSTLGAEEPDPQERTVMKQAAELLQEALRDAGASVEEVGRLTKPEQLRGVVTSGIRLPAAALITPPMALVAPIDPPAELLAPASVSATDRSAGAFPTSANAYAATLPLTGAIPSSEPTESALTPLPRPSENSGNRFWLFTLFVVVLFGGFLFWWKQKKAPEATSPTAESPTASIAAPPPEPPVSAPTVSTPIIVLAPSASVLPSPESRVVPSAAPSALVNPAANAPNGGPRPTRRRAPAEPKPSLEPPKPSVESKPSSTSPEPKPTSETKLPGDAKPPADSKPAPTTTKSPEFDNLF